MNRGPSIAGAVDLSALAARAAAPKQQSGAAPAPPPAPGGAAVVDVTEATFEPEIIARSQQELVIVLLWASWSEQSTQMAQTLQELTASAAGSWTLARVDVDAAPRVAQAFGAKGVPMVIALYGGRPVSAFDGPQPAAQVAEWITDVAAQAGIELTGGEPEVPEDPRMTAAEQLLESGDAESALAAYEAIVAVDPQNLEAASAARNIRFMLRAQQHDPAILETAEPGDVDAQLAAADVLLLGQRPEQAFDRLIDLIRVTDGDDRTKARTRLLELFDLFEPSEPFVVAARRKLATALY